ncbi:MAG: tetratricopeptide repeat protein, partial [Gemmatimonadetes bacterium]|nr:tetratricopeptide repeat protein [Gemmatimonadota bacterium]
GGVRSNACGPTVLGALCALAVAISACGAPDDPLAAVRELHANNQYAASLAPLRALLDENPDQPAVSLLLGKALMKTGDSSSAIWPLRRSLESPDHVVEAGLLLGRAELASRTPRDVVNAVEHVLRVEPDNVEALAHLAAAYGALGRFAKADRAIGNAIRIDPSNLQARVGAAILSFRKGLYAEAEVQLKTICDRNPSHGPAHFYRGEALNRLGRVDEALRTMERTIQLQPRNWRAYHTLGMLFDRKEDPERASAMYRQARELNHL